MKNSRFRLPKWSHNETKMKGNMLEQAASGASENDLEIQTRFFLVLGRFWTPFGTLFGAFWASWEPFGFPQAVFSAAFGSF